MPLGLKLRFAATLLGAVPGARAELRGRNGNRILVGAHPACDLTPAQFRLLAGLAGPCAPTGAAMAFTGAVSEVELAGALVPEGAGLYRRRTAEGHQQRWWATVLPAPAVVRLLAGHRARPGWSLSATAVADPVLGTTAVCVSNGDAAGRGVTHGGATHGGVTADGAMADGAMADGAMADGASSDGASSNGASSGGASSGGDVAVPGAPGDWTARHDAELDAGAFALLSACLVAELERCLSG